MLKGVAITMNDTHPAASRTEVQRRDGQSVRSPEIAPEVKPQGSQEDSVALRSEAGEARTARLSELRAQFQAGTYQVDADQVSHSILDRHLLS